MVVLERQPLSNILRSENPKKNMLVSNLIENWLFIWIQVIKTVKTEWFLCQNNYLQQDSKAPKQLS